MMGHIGKKFSVQHISKNLGDLQATHFDVVIVGSGYGGSIAASRLASAGKSVCLLERGREILPGDYPTDLQGANRELQLITARKGRLDPDKNGMMEVRVNGDVHVIVGNGLGGGSLVNAGVSIQPDLRVFQTGWPKDYIPSDGDDAKPRNTLTDYFARVMTNLGATKLPEGKNPSKLKALEQSAKAMKQNFERADINVTFEDGPNAFGFHQAACTMCGDCCSGCNYGAKNTLLMNYLPDARCWGAEIVTEAEVSTITPDDGGGWSVSVLDRTKSIKEQDPQSISADMVILAAGALGSTEILCRSGRAENGPSLSKALGSNFSANGDVLGFGFGANLPGSNGSETDPQPLYSIGAGSNPPISPQYQPGPCITGVIRVDMHEGKPLEHGMVIEDGTAPGPFATIYPPALFLQDVLTADFSDFPDAQVRLEALQKLGESLQSGGDPAALCYSGVMTQMQSYLLMSHDSASGSLDYDDTTGFVNVNWLGAGSGETFLRDNEKLKDAADGIWANYIANPIWQTGFGRNIVSVHPLGGCPMSDSEEDGVTDADCRVYKGDGKNSVYDNLLVCDGSVLPKSLGVNPLLTISAITERAMDKLVGPPKKPGSWPEPHIPPAVLGPAETASQGGPDWQAIAMGIGAAGVVADSITQACKEKNNTLSIALIEAFLIGIIPNYKAVDLTLFVGLFFGQSSWEDLGSAFEKVSDDLHILFAAASDVQSGGPIQPFLNTFFDIIGDVSPSFGFDETMHGYVSDRRLSQDDSISDPYEVAEAVGRGTDQAMCANFTVNAKQTLGRDAKNNVIAKVVGADLGGYVYLTGADSTPVEYTVKGGSFDLLQPDPDTVETWLMTYSCKLQAKGASSPTWEMRGTKYLRKRPGSSWWTDLTTLFVFLEPVDADGQETARQGIIRLDLQDLAAQMATLKTGFEGAITVEQLKTEAKNAAYNETLTKQLSDKDDGLLQKAFLVLLASSASDDADGWPSALAVGLEKFFGAGIAQIFATLVLRTYGGFVAYMNDFPSQSDATLKALPEPGVDKIQGSICEDISLPNADAPQIRLFHFAPPDSDKPARGPVLLAPGMSTTALSYALQTNKTSLVERLLKENYDVWLFDSRLSPRVKPIHTDYTLDDVAAEDWPMAVDYVLANSKVPGTDGKSIQIIGHCVGALTAQMALLGGHVETEKVRRLVVMQFTVHPSASWFNVVKSELGLAKDFSSGFPPFLASLIHAEVGDGPAWDAIKDVLTKGVPRINPVSPPPDSADYQDQAPLDQIHNAVDWNAPFGIDHVCLSPTCHRIYGLYGPVIAHKNLNEATHNAMRQIFGEIATKPFEQLGLIMERRRAVSSTGEDIYLPNFERLKLPIHIISGTINQIVLPESGYFTQQWLKDMMPTSSDLFTRTLIEGYAHNDCIIGKNADTDVFNGIMDVLKTKVTD